MKCVLLKMLIELCDSRLGYKLNIESSGLTKIQSRPFLVGILQVYSNKTATMLKFSVVVGHPVHAVVINMTKNLKKF